MVEAEWGIFSVRILLVHNSYQSPGGEDRVYEVERDLLRAYGHEVVEYRRSNKEIEEYSTFDRVMLGPRTVWSSRTRREFAELLRDSRVDLVHVHNTLVVISPSIYSACKEQQIPVVQTLHNFRLLCPRGDFLRDSKPCHDCTTHLAHSVLHACYRGSRSSSAAVAVMLKWHRLSGTYSALVDRYIALSEFARENFVAGGLERDRVSVKPNCVRPDPGERAGDGAYALFVGRLETEKGVHTLLAAWGRMSQRIPLRLAGTGQLLGKLKAAAMVREQIEFLGQLSSERLMEVIKGARFLVCPSVCYENFPMSVAEAYACGVPVLASELGSMKELVRPDRTGLLFRAGDADDLSAKALFAWNNREYLKKLGRQARREYELKYTAERNYEMLREIYQSVLPKRTRASATPDLNGHT